MNLCVEISVNLFTGFAEVTKSLDLTSTCSTCEPQNDYSILQEPNPTNIVSMVSCKSIHPWDVLEAGQLLKGLLDDAKVGWIAAVMDVCIHGFAHFRIISFPRCGLEKF